MLIIKLSVNFMEFDICVCTSVLFKLMSNFVCDYNLWGNPVTKLLDLVFIRKSDVILKLLVLSKKTECFS